MREPASKAGEPRKKGPALAAGDAAGDHAADLPLPFNPLWFSLATRLPLGASAGDDPPPGSPRGAPSRLPEGVQAKLSIGAPNDAYEQEADRAASAVTAGTPVAPVAGMRERVAPAAGGGEPAGPAARIAAPDAGRPLSPALRAEMEGAFGADFSAVRIHDTRQAQEDAESLGARAFTHRNGIWLGPGSSASDRGLMAHELTHVVQQGAAVRRKPVDPAGGRTPPAEERVVTGAPDIQAAWYNFRIPYTDYEFDPSISGVKTAAGLARDAVVDTAVWAKDNVVGAFEWVFDKIKELVTSGITWLTDKFDEIKAFATSSFDTVRSKLSELMGSISSPVDLLTQAFTSMNVGLLKAAWNGLKAGVRMVWTGIRVTIDAVLGIGNGLWKSASGFVNGLFSAIGGIIDSWPFRQLPGFMQRAARKLYEELRELWITVRDYLGDLLRRLNTFVQEILDSIERFAAKITNYAIQKVIDAVRAISEAWDFVKKVAADPEGYIRPILDSLAAKIEGEAPAKAVSLGEEKLQEKFRPDPAGGDRVIIQRTPSGSKPARSTASFSEVWTGFKDAISKAWSGLDIRKMLWESVVNMFWPPATIRAIGHEFSELWNNDWANTASSLFVPRAPWDDFGGFWHDLWTNILTLLDFPLALWRRLNNVLMLLLGYITIVLVIVFAIAGGVAGAAAGGAGAIPGALAGAVAGLKMAAAFGKGLLISYFMAEGATVVKSFADLFTARQTQAEKNRDYVQIAASLIGMGIAAAIVALLWLLSAMIAGVVRLIRGKSAPPPPPAPAAKKTPPASDPAAGGGGKTGEGVKTPEQPKVEQPKTEQPKTEEPKVEQPKTEQPKTEQPKTEQPKTEQPKTEEPGSEQPKSETPKAEEPVSAVEGKPNVFQVKSISALKASKPKLISVANKSLWHWELYVELPNGQRAVFCEVNLRPSPYGGTSPDLNLHPKTATVAGGGTVELLNPPGARWTSEALRLTIESYKAKFGRPPPNMGGWLAHSNLRNFQDTFARLRSENPGLSNETLGEMAMREISFGSQRKPFGYTHFKVTIAKAGKVKLSNGNVETVPTAVRVEATLKPLDPGISPKMHPVGPEPLDPEGEDGQ